MSLQISRVRGRQRRRQIPYVGLLTASALRGLDTAETRDRARHALESASRAASDRRVRAQSHRAKRDALRAAHRVQRIGVARALTDKRVARRLRLASRHASRAASLSLHGPRRHRVRNTAVIVVGTGAVAGTVYAATRSPGDHSDS